MIIVIIIFDRVWIVCNLRKLAPLFGTKPFPRFIATVAVMHSIWGIGVAVT